MKRINRPSTRGYLLSGSHVRSSLTNRQESQDIPNLPPRRPSQIIGGHTVSVVHLTNDGAPSPNARCEGSPLCERAQEACQKVSSAGDTQDTALKLSRDSFASSWCSSRASETTHANYGVKRLHAGDAGSWTRSRIQKTPLAAAALLRH